MWGRNIDEMIDWKDFCYSVLKDHTHQSIEFKLEHRDAYKAWKGTGMTEVKKKDEKHEVVPLFETITGGRGGDKNWLAKLPIKTVFLCKGEKQGCILTQFHILSKYKKSALLMSNYPGPDFRVFVEMASFSTENELVEIMQDGKDDGDSHSHEAGLDQS